MTNFEYIKSMNKNQIINIIACDCQSCPVLDRCINIKYEDEINWDCHKLINNWLDEEKK